MNKKKIAVCISGQSRFWKTGIESFKGFFDSAHADYTIFAHTWNINTSKTSTEIETVDIDDFERSFRSSFENVGGLSIDDYDSISKSLFDVNPRSTDIPIAADKIPLGAECAVFNRKPTAWLPLFYSAMVSNVLKQQYEMQNNMYFDVVVRTRFDNWYHSINGKFSDWTNNIDHRELYGNLMVFKEEYYLPAINDTFYYGNSETMDIVDSFYNSYQTGNFFRLLGSNGRDPAYKLVGPNVLLYKWATQKNIMIKQRRYYKWGVIRAESAHATWPDDDDFVVDTFFKR